MASRMGHRSRWCWCGLRHGCLGVVIAVLSLGQVLRRSLEPKLAFRSLVGPEQFGLPSRRPGARQSCTFLKQNWRLAVHAPRIQSLATSQIPNRVKLIGVLQNQPVLNFVA